MVQAIRRHPTAFLGISLLVFFVTLGPRLLLTSAAAPPGAEPTAVELSDALYRAGLDAESLSAAGVSGEAIGHVVDDVAEFLTANPDDLSDADAAYATARGDEAELKRLVASGLGSAEDTTAYQTAKSALESAETAREAAVEAIFDAGSAGLTGAQVTALSNMRANADWRLPKEYLCVNRSQEDWVALRDALANIRISADFGEEADDACESLVATCDAQAAVATAITGLDTNLSANQTAWETAVGL